MAFYVGDEPYAGCKVYGPYQMSGKSSNRKFVIIHYLDGSVKTMSYARFKYELRLGASIHDGYDVDHIDGNPSNDAFCNLQLLTSTENRIKGPSKEVKQQLAVRFSKLYLGRSNPSAHGQFNGNAKLTSKIVACILRDVKNYTRGLDNIVAIRYNVSRSTVSQIRRGIGWQHMLPK